VVLSWSGTADSVTSDLVSSWAASPTFAANWTAENSASSNTLTTTEQTFRIEGIAIDKASAKNIAVFIFCDQTDGAIDDAVYITGVQIELGEKCTEFEFRHIQAEKLLCQRYLYRRDSATDAYAGYSFGMASAANAVQIIFIFPVVMRSAPTRSNSDVATFKIYGIGEVTALTQNRTNEQSYILTVGYTPAGLTANYIYELIADNDTGSWINWSAEL
jgi:hypothetical protein